MRFGGAQYSGLVQSVKMQQLPFVSIGLLFIALAAFQSITEGKQKQQCWRARALVGRFCASEGYSRLDYVGGLFVGVLNG